MASPLDIKLILCDAAVADPAGKLHMLGAGWSVTGTPTTAQAVAMLIKIPWDRANKKLPLALKLLDPDGKQVSLPALDGQPVPIGHEGAIEVGRPAGVASGSMLDAALAISISPMPLPPGRYEWRLDIADQTVSESFTVRPPGIR
jgi:hypothetical protein